MGLSLSRHILSIDWLTRIVETRQHGQQPPAISAAYRQGRATHAGLELLAAVVTILLLGVTVPARAYTSPLDTIPGFWSFAARNDAITMVVFPAWWPTLGPATDRYTFEVQKSRHR